MKLLRVERAPGFRWRSILWMAAPLLLLGAGGPDDAPRIRRASLNSIAGITEPDALIAVATAETGILQRLHVEENDVVEEGQILATLDDDLYRAQVAIAEQEARAMGRVKAAQAERLLRERRLAKLVALEKEGKAHPEEMDRARTDLAVADAQLESALDEQKLFELQLERARLQLKKRSIFAPTSGVVVDVHKRAGEYLSPTSPQLLQLARLHPLRAKFLVTRSQLPHFKPGEMLQVHFPDSGQSAPGKIDRISPVSDAESGLTEVEVLIDNPTNLLRGGDRCTCELPR